MESTCGAHGHFEPVIMIDPVSINSAAMAFVAGLITSVHCVGMCGPFACMLQPKPGSGESMLPRLVSYHVVRILSYGVIGAALGALGQVVLDRVNASVFLYLPWLLVVFFVAIAVRADRWLPKPKFLSRFVFRMGARFQRAPGWMSGGILGACTPFLPCGPLYLVFGLALVMGSPLKGAEFLIAFGLGTLPFLFFAQSQYVRLARRLSPLWMDRLQRGTALVMALLVAWRLNGVVGAGLEVACPFCTGG